MKCLYSLPELQRVSIRFFIYISLLLIFCNCNNKLIKVETSCEAKLVFNRSQEGKGCCWKMSIIPSVPSFNAIKISVNGNIIQSINSYGNGSFLPAQYLNQNWINLPQTTSFNPLASQLRWVSQSPFPINQSTPVAVICFNSPQNPIVINYQFSANGGKTWKCEEQVTVDCDDLLGCCDIIKPSFVNEQLVQQGFYSGSTLLTGTINTNGPIIRLKKTIVSATRITSCPQNIGPEAISAILFNNYSGITNFPIPQTSININEHIYLPDPPSCKPGTCKDKIEICIKYELTNSKCITCEQVRCYSLDRSCITAASIQAPLKFE